MKEKFNITFTGEGEDIDGKIEAAGSTTFLQSCLAEIIRRMAEMYETTPKHVLVDIWHVIEEEDDSNGSDQLH